MDFKISVLHFIDMLEMLRDSPTVCCLCAFFPILPQSYVPFYVAKKTLDNIMCLLEFECTKRLRAHSRAIPECCYLQIFNCIKGEKMLSSLFHYFCALILSSWKMQLIKAWIFFTKFEGKILQILVKQSQSIATVCGNVTARWLVYLQ